MKPRQTKTTGAARGRRARLAVSIGCPCGVGAEVSVAAAAESEARVLLIGDAALIADAAEMRGVDDSRLVRVTRPTHAWQLPEGSIGVFQPTTSIVPKDRASGAPTPASGAAQLAWINAACDLVSRNEADAMVTGPVSKDAISRSRAPGSAGFRGHTEHLQRRLGAREVVMAFWSEPLTTALVTTHLPLAAVPRAITAVAVARAAFWLGVLLTKLGVARAEGARIAVAGLNPHAGESGLLGDEEIESIAPGIETARKRLARERVSVVLVGPVPAESAFRRAVAGDYDGVVAMYHDQATIPMKLVGFGEAVNVSLGLPIVRTSVDHGTAYDRAGQGTADPRGMGEAMSLASRLVIGGRERAATPARAASRRKSSRR